MRKKNIKVLNNESHVQYMNARSTLKHRFSLA